jgi:hypothetical protein
MTRSGDDRVADVRRLLGAAAAVFGDRARLVPAIAEATGLSREGVELGFESLEREATDEALRALVAFAGDAPHVHVVLSANVFVAPLRALAVARAAAARVTIRPSSRDPILTHALVEAAGDAAIRVVDERDVGAPGALEAGEVHVYGRDETIAAVRARLRDRPAVTVRGHGAGLGLAVVTGAAGIDGAAAAVARDVVAFDQRGCLSPRLVVVEGDAARGLSFARALHEHLAAWAVEVPRGALVAAERAEAARWRETATFAGDVFAAVDHAVALAPVGAPWWPAPAGRHVQVVAHVGLAGLAGPLAAIAPFVAAVGSDDPARVRASLPADVASGRTMSLGHMQRPPLDGPVDRRRGRES